MTAPAATAAPESLLSIPKPYIEKISEPRFEVTRTDYVARVLDKEDGSIDYQVRFDAVSDSRGLTLEGYAAVFDQPTRISNAFEGDFTETVRQGAFSKMVRQNPPPVVQFDHGTHPMIGQMPIAAPPSSREDARGLWVSTTVHDNWMTIPVRDAIESGAIPGWSFRFIPNEGGDQWDTMRENRDLLDLKVFELGPVVFPAYTGTEIALRMAKQLREAPEQQFDLIRAIFLDPWSNPDPEEPRSEASEEDPIEETADQDDPSAEVADRSETSAPNPARSMATLIAVRTSAAVSRSNYDPEGLPDQ